MSLERIALRLAVTICLALGLSGGVAAVPFTTGFTAGGTWNTIYAQGFSPSEMPSADPGVGLTDPVSLNRIDFFKSGTADTAANVQLAVVSNYFLNLQNFTTSSPELVGLSTNTVASTVGIATGGPISFNFDALQLTYGQNYAAIFVNNNGGMLTPVLVSALTANYEEDPPGSGMYLPIINYGDPDPDFPGNYFLATSNFTHTDDFGTFFDTFGGAGDANFVAYFNQEALGGDFNGDGSVDAADYVAWRKNDGTTPGYEIWRANFGGPSAGGAAALGQAAAVPEPATIVLLTIATGGMRSRRRMRRYAANG